MKMDFLGLRNYSRSVSDAGEHRDHEEAGLTSTTYPSTTRRPTSYCWGRVRPSASSSSMAAACAVSSKLMTDLRGHLRRCPVPTRPNGRNSHANFALRRRADARRSRHSPRARRGRLRILGTTLRIDRLPGTGHCRSPRNTRAAKRAVRHPAQGDGQERKKEVPGSAVQGLPPGHDRQRLLGGSIRPCAGRCRSFSACSKAHSAAYGLVSYWTAFLKANYPTNTWRPC